MYETFTLRSLEGGASFDVYDQTQKYPVIYSDAARVGRLELLEVQPNVVAIRAERRDGTRLEGGVHEGHFLPQEINAAAQLLWDDWDMRRQAGQ